MRIFYGSFMRLEISLVEIYLSSSQEFEEEGLWRIDYPSSIGEATFQTISLRLFRIVSK